MWNMQSGAHRTSFNIGPCPEGVHTKYPRPPGKQRSEERCVTGLATDSLNRVAIASTLDGTVNVRAHAMIVREPKLEICSQKVFQLPHIETRTHDRHIRCHCLYDPPARQRSACDHMR